jgi:hypothetical protein
MRNSEKRKTVTQQKRVVTRLKEVVTRQKRVVTRQKRVVTQNRVKQKSGNLCPKQAFKIRSCGKRKLGAKSIVKVDEKWLKCEIM